MKKLLLSFAICFLFHSLTAQMAWCPPGAKWHFHQTGGFPGHGLKMDIDLAYTGDTTLLGISCKKLKGISIGQYNAPNSPIGTTNYNTYYTYQNNNVIYLYNNSDVRFDTVVDFNATPGDQWLSPEGGFQVSPCLNRFLFTVADTAHVTINGFSLKKMTITYTYSAASTSSAVSTYTNVFLERILFTGGGIMEHYNLFPTHCQMQDAVVDIPYTAFRCYEDSIFPVYNPANNGCKDYWTGINQPAQRMAGFAMYPNPAHELLTIELPGAGRYSIRLVSLLGQTLPMAISGTGDSMLKADLGTLEPGIYFIQILENGLPVGVEKLIKK